MSILKNLSADNSETLAILREFKDGSRNPNTFTLSWYGESLPSGTTWSTGFYGYDIIAYEWGFQLIKDNGRIAPPTQVNFGKYATETDFYGCYERAMDFLKTNCERSQALPAYLWGE